MFLENNLTAKLSVQKYNQLSYSEKKIVGATSSIIEINYKIFVSDEIKSFVVYFK